jgi:hypothetical protein
VSTVSLISGNPLLINLRIKSLLLFFGPILLPKAISYYRSLRAGPAIHGLSIQPVPPNVARALLILVVTTISFLFTTLVLPSPENIFSRTQSRLQIPIDVLFTRLHAIRPHGLTPADAILRSKIESRDSRLLYLQYGPEVLTSCQFCNPEEPSSYFYYALPALLGPHLFNLCVLALATSGLLTGKHGAVWRTASTIGAIGVALADVYLVNSYAYQENSMALRLQDLDMFFWKMRIYRGLALALLDGIVAYVLYLSSTNRAFVQVPAPAERVEAATRVLDTARSKIGALSALRNTITRDEGLTALSRAYWVDYGRLMGEAMEDREVIEGVNNALESRINVGKISTDADTYIEAVFNPLTSLPTNGSM